MIKNMDMVIEPFHITLSQELNNIQMETNTKENFIRTSAKMIKEFILCRCNSFKNLYYSANGDKVIGKWANDYQVGEHIGISQNKED